MAGKYEVILSRHADEMLIRHARFLAQVSPKAARKMVREFEKILDTLETSPLQFPVEEDYNLPKGIYRKVLFCKWYKALFMVQDQRVYLDVVLDCRQENADL